MAYERVNWENLPSKNTPVNADNLNKLNDAIDQKADSSDVYNKTEIDEKMNAKANSSDVYNKIDKKINILENGTYQNYIVCLADSLWSGIVPLPNADEYNITINSLLINQVQYPIKEVINVTKTGFQCLLTSKVAITDYGIINYTIVHK